MSTEHRRNAADVGFSSPGSSATATDEFDWDVVASVRTSSWLHRASDDLATERQPCIDTLDLPRGFPNVA
jgi:hypothetical protein